VSIVAAIDEFQTLVYDEPRADAGTRAKMWSHVERTYMPWRHRGAQAAIDFSRAWHRQRHVFGFPFYYIDYALALCCALQIWSNSTHDRKDTLDRFVTFCRRGGELPFREALAAAGLRSPFERGALADVATLVRTYLAD